MRYLLFLFTFISTSLHAQNVWHNAKITEIYPNANGGVIVRFDSDKASCTNTHDPKDYHLEIGSNGVSEQGFNNMYTAILSAAAMNKEVTFLFDDSDTNCPINKLKITY